MFANSVGPVGAGIRLGEVPSPESVTDRFLPVHACLSWDMFDQWFAMEVGPGGPTMTSMDRYRGKFNQIIAIWRWDRLANDQELMLQARRKLALWLRQRQNEGYPIGTALRASDWVRKVLPFLKKSNKLDICSEQVSEFYTSLGMDTPADWPDNPPNPLKWWQFLSQRKDGHFILGYKAC